MSTSSPAPLLRETFPAMGNTVVLDAPDAAAVSFVRSRLGGLEAAWSRFIPTSDISRLNNAQGSWVPVRTDTLSLLSFVVAAARVTNGLFDPTLLPTLMTLGYAQSRTSCLVSTVGARSRPHCPDLVDRIGQRRVNAGYQARFPVGLTIDPGAFAKGLAADIVSVELTVQRAARCTAGDNTGVGVCVSVGGDLRFIGSPRPIPVLGPSGDVLTLLATADGGLATSSVQAKTWPGPGDTTVHHVLDPRTMAPVDNDLLQVTVAASSAAWAEVFATAVLVSGSCELVDRLGLGALLVHADGSVTASKFWKDSV